MKQKEPANIKRVVVDVKLQIIEKVHVKSPKFILIRILEGLDLRQSNCS